MIEISKQLSVRLFAVLALALAACTADSSNIPCADDFSCPADVPVCSGATATAPGKCVAGTSTPTVEIVGIDGQSGTAPQRGTISVLVSAKATSGVKAVSLAGGGKTFSPAAGVTGPVYPVAVDTTQFADGSVSLTATVTPGSGAAVSSTAFALTVDNTAPVLTSSATIPAAQVGSMVALDVTASEAVASIPVDIIFSGDVVGHGAEIAAPTGNVHHLGYAVVSGTAPGAYTMSVTAVDAAGNPTAAPLTKPFNVVGLPSASLISDVSNIGSGGTAKLTPTFTNGTGTWAANPADATLPASPTSGQQISVQPTTTTTYTLTVTNAAAAVATSSVTVTVGQNVSVSLSAPGAAINPGATATLSATVGANAVKATIEPGNIAVTADGASHNVNVTPSATTTYALIATNSAGQEFRTTATVTVTQPAIVSFSGPQTVTTNTGPTWTVQFTPATATAAVNGCVGGSVSGTSPASQTFTCSAITSQTIYTLTLTLGTVNVTSSHTVQVAPDPTNTSLAFTGGSIAPGAQADFSGQGCTGCTVTFSPPMAATPDTGSYTGAFTSHLASNPSASTTVTMTVTNAAGVSATKSDIAVVAQPAIAGFAGPDSVTTGGAPTLTALYNPSSATATVSGCTGGAPTGSNPTSRTFSCGTITTDTTYTLNVGFGTASVQATTIVQVAPDPASGLAFTASPAALPFGTTTNQTTLTAQFCGGSARCSASFSSNGGAPASILNNTGTTVNQTSTTTYTLVATNQAGASASAQITVPTYGTQFSTNTMNSAREGAAVAMLLDGRVLVAGGSTDNTAANAVASAEIFDASTGAWTNVGCSCAGTASCGGTGTPQASLHVARFQATATLVSGGGVVIAGGANNSSTGLTSIEVYDPGVDCFRTQTSPLGTGRAGHTATAYNGAQNVVFIGGSTNKQCDIYGIGGSINGGTVSQCSGTDPSNKDMQTARTNHVAVLLSGNRYVLLAGGSGDQSADIFDTTVSGVNAFTNLSATTMQASRTSASGTLLSSGKVLVAGGGSATAELFTFNSGTVSGTTAATTNSMSVSRTGHAAILLNGGAVLLAGGNASKTVDVYDPTSNSFGASFSLGTARAGPTFGLALLIGGRALVGGGTTTATAADYIVP